MAAVGEDAPGFSLPGTGSAPDGTHTYALEQYRGQPVVVVFYPGDSTPVCTRQLNAYTNDVDAFAEAGAQVLAISPQSVASHDEFASKQGGFAFPLLADEDKAVGRAYGIVGPLGLYRRSAFVVDGAGVIRYVHRSLASLSFRPSTELVAAVKKATG
ncbi:MAG: peroxiredoxin [Acidimicrobiales bacterium]